MNMAVVYRTFVMKNMQYNPYLMTESTVHSLSNWLWGIYHGPRRVFLVSFIMQLQLTSPYRITK